MTTQQLGRCRECGTTTGGGGYCWQHAPYTVTPLKDGTWRETRGELTHVLESSCPQCSDYRHALTALVAAIERVTTSPEYQAVFTLASVHGIDYTGPQFNPEYTAARELLERTRV